jgi:hypothetical protein
MLGAMLRLAELLCPLAAAADSGAGLPPEIGARTALIGMRLAERCGLAGGALGDADYAGLLRHLEPWRSSAKGGSAGRRRGARPVRGTERATGVPERHRQERARVRVEHRVAPEPSGAGRDGRFADRCIVRRPDERDATSAEGAPEGHARTRPIDDDTGHI